MAGSDEAAELKLINTSQAVDLERRHGGPSLSSTELSRVSHSALSTLCRRPSNDGSLGRARTRRKRAAQRGTRV